MCSTSPKQGGYAALALVLVLITVLSALVASYEARRGYVGVSRTDRLERDYLERAKNRITRFYAAHAAAMDTNAAAPWSDAQILISADVPLRWQVQVFIGGRQSVTVGGGSTTMDYRDIWLALPGTAQGGQAQPASLDTGTNTFLPGTSPAWTEVSGEAIENGLYVRAQRQLTRLGARLTAMYAADLATDGNHNIGVDDWQPTGCGPYGGGVIACTNGQFVPVSTLNVTTALGAQRIDTDNPWGEPLLASNTVDANTTAPPYTIILQSPLPWGGNLTNTIAEPIT